MGETETDKMEAGLVTLRVPVDFGGSRVEVLRLRATAKAFRDFTLPMKDDGTILFQPYKLAEIGVAMAGHPRALVDKLDPADMMEVAQLAMGFLVPGPATGSAPSLS